MGAKEWYIEKENAQNEYNAGRISYKIYEIRIKNAIRMIYKCGSKKDKVAAEGIAKAHGYNIKDIIK